METPTTAQGTWPSAEEAGFLTAGPRRAAETVLARLIDTGLVRVSRDGLVSAVHQNGQGATTSVEARMLSHAQTAVRFDTIVQSIARSTEIADLYRHLFSRRLMQVPRRRGDGWWFSLAVAGMLTLARRTDMTSRSELGLQLDAKLIAGATPVTGFVRAAWAHYYQRDAELAASLNGLPGASFTATGARLDRNAALLAAGADIKLSQSVSLGMRVDSELSARTRRVGGTAQLRVSF